MLICNVNLIRTIFLANIFQDFKVEEGMRESPITGK